MGSAKLLALLLSVVFLAGCSSIMGQSRMEYQEGRAAVQGQTYSEYKGLYSVAFPGENYYVERSYFRMAFIPKDNWIFQEGPYAIKVFHNKNLAKTYRNDMVKTFDLMERKEIGQKAFKQAVTLKQEVREFQGDLSLYREFFVPESIRKNIDGDTVKDPARGFVALLTMRDDNVYWIVHSQPIDELVLEGKKIQPRVNAKTVEQMKQFLNGFSFAPTK